MSFLNSELATRKLDAVVDISEKMSWLITSEDLGANIFDKKSRHSRSQTYVPQLASKGSSTGKVAGKK